MVYAQQALHASPNQDLVLRAKEREVREKYKIAHKNYTAFLSQKAKLKWLTYGITTQKLFTRV